MPSDSDIVARMAAILDSDRMAGSVDAARVDATEAALGVRFPHSYRLFLLNFGAGPCRHYEIFGIDPNPDEVDGSSVHIDVLQMNRDFRGVVADPPLPASFLNISDDGGDFEFFLDTARPTSDRECPVVAIGPSGEANVIADSFVRFLELSDSKT